MICIFVMLLILVIFSTLMLSHLWRRRRKCCKLKKEFQVHHGNIIENVNSHKQYNSYVDQNHDSGSNMFTVENDMTSDMFSDSDPVYQDIEEIVEVKKDVVG